MPQVQDLSDSVFTVHHIADDGSEEILDVTVEDGAVVFETEAFSIFKVTLSSDSISVNATTTVHFVNDEREEIDVQGINNITVGYKKPVQLEELAQELWGSAEIPNKDGYVFSHVYLKTNEEKPVKYMELNRDNYNSVSGKYRVWFYQTSYTDTNTGGNCAGLYYTWTSGQIITDDVYFVFNRINDVSFCKTDETGEPLTGALFGLYSDSECNDLVAQSRSDNHGIVTFSKISFGTYYLKENSAPSGFNRATIVFTMVIGTTVTIDGKTDFKLVNKENDGRVEISDTKKITVNKQWIDSENHNSDRVEVTLYNQDDTVVDVLHLNINNSWTGTIQNLDPTKTYFLKETGIYINDTNKTEEYKADIALKNQSSTTTYTKVNTFDNGEYVLQFNSNSVLSGNSAGLSVAAINTINSSTVNYNMLWEVVKQSDGKTLTLKNKLTQKYLSINSSYEWQISDGSTDIKYNFSGDQLYLYYNTAYVDNRYNYFMKIASSKGVYTYTSDRKASTVTTGGTAFTLYKRSTVYESEYTITNSPNEYDLQFKKVDYEHPEQPVESAEFALYKEPDTVLYNSLISDSNGVLSSGEENTFKLRPGTYYLIETSSPNNFLRLSKPVKFTITQYGRIVVENKNKEFADFNYVENECIVIPNKFYIPPPTNYTADTLPYIIMFGAAAVTMIPISCLLLKARRRNRRKEDGQMI